MFVYLAFAHTWTWTPRRVSHVSSREVHREVQPRFWNEIYRPRYRPKIFSRDPGEISSDAHNGRTAGHADARFEHTICKCDVAPRIASGRNYSRELVNVRVIVRPYYRKAAVAMPCITWGIARKHVDVHRIYSYIYVYQFAIILSEHAYRMNITD